MLLSPFVPLHPLLLLCPFSYIWVSIPSLQFLYLAHCPLHRCYVNVCWINEHLGGWVNNALIVHCTVFNLSVVLICFYVEVYKLEAVPVVMQNSLELHNEQIWCLLILKAADATGIGCWNVGNWFVTWLHRVEYCARCFMLILILECPVHITCLSVLDFRLITFFFVVVVLWV